MNLPDYNTALPERKRTAYSVLKGLLLAAAADMLFYRRFWVFFLLLVPAALYVRYDINEARRERRLMLRNDFREALASIAASLRAGMSVENAIPEAARELALRPGGQTDCAREFAYMAAQMRLSVPPERLMSDFAARSHVEDVEDFSAVFEAGRRSGGHMAAIMRDAASKIAAKIDSEREIEAALAAKRYEQRIMSIMPAGIILYVSLTSPGYFDILYTTAFGAVVMTACLLLYALGVYWGTKIADIRI
jgi:tight adherence protein B